MHYQDVELHLPHSDLTLRGKHWNPTSTTGTPVLCLHGWQDNCNTFDKLLAAFPDMNCLAIDLPGHGLSDHLPASAHYHYLPLAGYIVELILSQGWEKVHLLGHCMGGILFLLVSAMLPERVQKLVIMEAISPYLGTAEEQADSVTQHCLSRTNERYETHPCYPDRKKVFQLRRTGGDMLFSTAELLTARDLLETAEGYTLRMDPRLRRPFLVCFSEETFATYLHRVHAPVLYIGAERPYQVDEALRQRQISRLKDIRYEIIPGGHYIHIENVEPVAQCIREFLHA